MSKNITKERIINSITDKEAIFDIKKEDAEKAISEMSFNSCKIYRTYHYSSIYRILKNKLEQISDILDKESYLNCLLMNYTDLQNTSFIDILLSLLTGGILGSSLLDITTKVTLGLLWLFLLVMKMLIITNRRYQFLCLIIQQLKEEL